MSTIGKSMETESKFVVAKNRGGLLNGYEFLGGMMKLF